MERVDARYKSFKEKVKKLGYMKGEAKKVAAVMEKVADFGMMSDAGNIKIARAVAKAKNEKELRTALDKIASMAGGKYAEAGEDDVIQRAVWALSSTATGIQLRPDAQVLMQLKKLIDTKRDQDIRTDDMKKVKVKAADAEKVHDVLMQLKTPVRSKYLRLLQKDIKSFKTTFAGILKVANR
jgi:hypothetical protein